MEAVNLGAGCDECDGNIGENRTFGSLHFGGEWPDNTHLSAKRSLGDDSSDLTDYHIYAIEWGEGVIHWFVDGEKLSTLTSEDWFSGGVSKADNLHAPFDQPFYLMINLAVGGKLSETNNDKSFNPDTFPTGLLVDWVRVYQCAEDPESGRACMVDNE